MSNFKQNSDLLLLPVDACHHRVCMSDCKKNTDIPLLGFNDVQIRNIRFNDLCTEILLYATHSTTTECSRVIDSNTYLGLKIENNELVFSDSFTGLTTNVNMALVNNPMITIDKVNNVLKIIGLDDLSNGFTASQVNVRFNSATNCVNFQV